MLAECSLFEHVNWRRLSKRRRGVSNLTVLAPPDKIGFALTSAHFILLEAAYRNEVGVCLAT
jgi:hypothetical protein